MSGHDKLAITEPCGCSLEELQRLSDESLMAHLRAGHADVLAIIFDRYNRLVLSVAMKLLRDLGEAEDLMQTVFFEIYRAAAQFDPARGTLKVWILQYAYHRGMSRRRYLSSRSFYKNSDLPVESLEVSHFSDQEIRRLVTQALESLNETQSTVLRLAYFEGLSMKEIAERTEESLGNVRHHYYRGLSKLRAIVTAQPKSVLETQEQADANA
jgi:RNA polymerase sigma-70 factor (ECF subfamily)